MKKVLLSGKVNAAAMKMLEGRVDYTILPDTSPETAKKMIADVDGVVLRTNIHLTGDIITAGKNLKVISRTGVGVDNVDVAAATARKVMVCNTPGINTNSVAEHTLTFILALAKQVKMMDRAVAAGNWKIRSANKTMDVEGKTLGLVGLGKIGSTVAAKCRAAFGMKVLAYDPFVKEADGIEMVRDLADVFKRADFVSVHVPYMESTHHLVNASLISLMKPEAFIINTARGPLVEQAALVEALAAGKIAGAGLDVFDDEPPAADNPLLKFDNVISTPHAAALTRECEMKVAIEAVQAVLDVLEGRRPKYMYNQKELGG